MKQYLEYPVTTESHIGAAKRQLHEYCIQEKVNPTIVAEIDIIVTELAGNFIKHSANNGKLLYFINYDDAEKPVLEIIAKDSGPGIADIGRAVMDGYTTSHNSMGVGLGSVKRLSDEMEINSDKSGTIITVRKFLVKKSERGGRTYTDVSRLSREGRMHELARMAGGGYVTETMLRGADEMLCAAEEYKEQSK